MLHQIGVGVLGPVYRAYQPDPGRLVAVKQFRLDIPPESAHRFVAALERLIAADLTHLGIAAPLAAGLVENSPYLAMDFAAAESFDVVVRDYGPAPVAEALRVATQLGGALDFAAAVGVFHGSLHPRDVLISTDDTRVTGLGIAQALQDVGVLPPIRRPYTAPERVAGLAWDRRADSFSLAALVFEMLFGRRIAGVGREAADAIPSTDGLNVHAMRDLFARALAEDPAARFDTALAFADALHNAAAEPPAAPRAKGARGRKKASSEQPAAAPAAAVPPLPLPLDSVPAPETPAPEELEAVVQEAVDRALASVDAASSDDVPRAIDGAAESADASAHEASSATDAVPPIDTVSGIEDAHPGGAHVGSPVLAADSAAMNDRGARFTDAELTSGERDRFALADEGASAAPESMAVEEEEPLSLPLTSTAPSARLDTSDVAAPVEKENGNSGDIETPRDRRRGKRSGAAHRSEVDLPIAASAPAPAAPPRLSSVALEESRSAIWPIALALVVGLLVGFAFGYGAGTRERPGSTADVIASNSTAAEPDADRGAAGPSAAVRSSADAAAGADTSGAPGSSAGSASSPRAGGAPPPASSSAGGSTRAAAPPAASSSAGAASGRGAVAGRAERTREPAPARPRDEPGRLLVRSTPAGARVSVDGREVGVTPATVNDLATGAHVVRIQHQGYVTAERRVRIRSDQPAQSIQVELAAARPARASTPAPAVSGRSGGPSAGAPGATAGSLMVDSRPSGARVFVDGRLVGTTPLLLDAVDAGDHAVRLEMDGFSTWSTTTWVTGGERNRVSGSLEQR